jgi:hypothetical protein
MNSRSFHLRCLLLLPVVSVVGCVSGSDPMSSPVSGSLTSNATASAEPVVVKSQNFDSLWNASIQSLRDLHFEIDRQDRRSGIITTKPMTGSQFFEPWRTELRSVDAVTESSLATIRRTVTIRISRVSDVYQAVPEVSVDRLSRRERRITSAAEFTNAFKRNPARGTLESDRGEYIPSEYFYSIGTDPLLARHLASRLESHLRK